ncbi:MAG: sulfatase-like hydrolase/transferase [Isosphaeraceae bacterium]|nr:sulfatase-like hydrolase/transferase [Isosphaeraceae bacterium]
MAAPFRLLLTLARWAILVAAVLGPEPASSAAAERPNIIFLLTDDQRDRSIAAMGHPFVETPHLDALLRDSAWFANAYCATPVCCPSRVSYFTGMPERVHGVGFSSSYDLTREQWSRSYPALLRKAGYHTGFIGKFGVEYYEFRGRASEEFDYWWAHDGWTKFFPKDHQTPSTKPYHRAKNDMITSIMGEAMTEFLESAPRGKPFCLSVSFNVPHGSQTTSMGVDDPEGRAMRTPANANPRLRGSPFYDTLYRDIDIPLSPDTAGDPYRFIPKSILDQDLGRRNQTYRYDYEIATCREHQIRYHQTITGFDHAIGGLRADLERLGLAGNTVILFGSDHGLLMGEYGMGGKELLLDLASKIPSFVHDPRAPKAARGRKLEQLVSALDYPRTILDYAGVAAPAEMEGASLRPLVEGREVPWRDRLFLESLFTLRDNPFQEGIRTKRWKYLRMYDGVVDFREADVDFRGRAPEFEMLFDLEADPTEHRNLAAEPAHAAVLAELRAETAARSESLNRQRTDYLKDHRVARRGTTRADAAAKKAARKARPRPAPVLD